MEAFLFSPQVRVLGVVVVAMLLGGLIGLEREAAQRPAGLRTHMLVTGAACLFVLLGASLVDHFNIGDRGEVLRSDPIRLLEAVITGVSFLGAGTIIRGGKDQGVVGLTTAASILLAAGVGVAVALSQIVLALGVTGLALIALRGLRLVEKRMNTKLG